MGSSLGSLMEDTELPCLSFDHEELLYKHPVGAYSFYSCCVIPKVLLFKHVTFSRRKNFVVGENRFNFCMIVY